MIRVPVVQGVLVGVCATLAALHSALTGWSVLLGGLSIVLPNLLFAWRLKLASPNQAVIVWMVGELLKMMLSVTLLALVATWFEGLVWPGLLLGIAVAALSIFVAPWVLSRAVRQQDAQRIDRRLRQVPESVETK
ncbi:MAG: ATP synthase subunit I [Burkholderiaceae bacterium]|jgi:F0F1-type ATP synthase assembly protein I